MFVNFQYSWKIYARTTYTHTHTHHVVEGHLTFYFVHKQIPQTNYERARLVRATFMLEQIM